MIASYAIGFAQYADALIPHLNLKLVAAGVIVFCFVTNYFGVKTAARFQGFMVLVLIFSLLAYVVTGLGQVESYAVYVEPAHVFPSGFGGFLAAAFLLRLGLIGSEYVSELGDETRNPGKLIPLVMGSSLLIVTVLYMAIGVVATGVLPLEEVSGKNLAAVAKTLFSPGVYVLFVAGGVMLSLVTSLNAIFAWCTRGLYMATEDGWLPESLAAKNKYGTPYIFLSIFFFLGITPIVTGMSLASVTILGNAVGLIFGLFPVVALYNLAKRNPESYAKAVFRLPVWLTKALPIFSVVVYSYGIYLSREFIGWQGFTALTVYTAIAIGYAYYRSPVVELQMRARSHAP
jgi:APA family basic amino acid/polyamine antiporter